VLPSFACSFSGLQTDEVGPSSSGGVWFKLILLSRREVEATFLCGELSFFAS